MRRLLHAVVWDLRLQLRHHVITIAVLVWLSYVALFQFISGLPRDELTILLLFSDPTVFGFLFVGVLVMFERIANTLEAVAVSPLSPAQYLWSKALSLTLIALFGGVVMALGSHALQFSVPPLCVALGLSSVFFIFLGFAAVVRVRTVNAYLLVVPVFLLPLISPLLGYTGIVESRLFYLVPTQATLVLFERSFQDRPWWEWIYAVAYLIVCIAVAFRWARRSFEAYIEGAAG